MSPGLPSLGSLQDSRSLPLPLPVSGVSEKNPECPVSRCDVYTVVTNNNLTLNVYIVVTKIIMTHEAYIVVTNDMMTLDV